VAADKHLSDCSCDLFLSNRVYNFAVSAPVNKRNAIYAVQVYYTVV